MVEWSSSSYAEIEANGGSHLPHRDDDPIMRLSAHYNEPARFMHEQFVKLDGRAGTEKGLSRPKVMERRYFMMAWLAGLYVTMEGIETLPLKRVLEDRPFDMDEIVNSIPSLIVDFAIHRDALRLLRNAQYHYQKTADKHRQFFEDKDRLNWATHLQMKLNKIFSDYRVNCAVICMIAGRDDKVDIKRKPHWAGRMKFL